jgi:hypothetical protein
VISQINGDANSCVRPLLLNVNLLLNLFVQSTNCSVYFFFWWNMIWKWVLALGFNHIWDGPCLFYFFAEPWTSLSTIMQLTRLAKQKTRLAKKSWLTCFDLGCSYRPLNINIFVNLYIFQILINLNNFKDLHIFQIWIFF